MEKTERYKIEKPNLLKCGLGTFVEMEVDYTQCSFDPSTLKTEYFGTFENDEFVVYHRKVDIIIIGDIKDDELTVRFNFPSRWNYLFDIVIFTIVGVSIMWDINIIIGLLIIFSALGQKIYLFRKEEKIKADFTEKLNTVLEKIKTQNE